MKIVFTFYVALIGSIVFSQSKPNSEERTLIDGYRSYFDLPRETLFTHLNKTTYLAGENLWFKIYARDRHSDGISNATTNINVGIYSDKGQLIKNDLWFAKNGSTHGNVLIDSTFTSGDYYIKTSTHWMRNFDESHAFVQKIKIIGYKTIAELQDSTDNAYDLQFLPEGGHMVYGVPNVLGFKILDKNGKGIKITGTVYDDTAKETTTFKSNRFGIGKFLFIPESGKTYTARVNLKNGKTIKKRIDNINAIGISMNVNNLNSKKLIVTLNANKKTYKYIKDKKYNLAIHKNGKLKLIPFSFDKKPSKSLVLPKRDLYSDINIITLFDEANRPLLERLIFNDKFNVSKAKYNINLVKRENDSILLSVYSLNGFTKDSTNASSNLSISVLPQTTVGYNPDHNILSANYLKPYLRGSIESPMYYFKDTSNKTLYDLDMLLLTQGWSKYDWERIFNGAPKPIFDFENGITMRGKVNRPSYNLGKLRLQQPKLIGNNWKDIDVERDNTFEVKNFYPLKDEIIRIAYTDKKGRYNKPSLYVNYNVSLPNDFLADEFLKTEYSFTNDAPLPEVKYDDEFFYKDTVELEEVYLEGSAKKKKEKPKKTLASTLTFKDNYLAITPKELNKFPTVLDILRYKGVNVSTSLGEVFIGGAPVVFFDGTRIYDFNFLYQMSTQSIEGIEIDESGLGLGMHGGRGAIRIFSRRIPLYDEPQKKPDFAHKSTASFGFAKSKTFYNPRYKSYTSDIFKYYGTIGWFPNVSIGDNKSSTFKLPDTKSDVINFYIEGYDHQNKLVSQFVELNLDKNSY